MYIKECCNNCAQDHCKIARLPIAIHAENYGELDCFVSPNTRNFKFTDLVSKVVIINYSNPVIQWLIGYQGGK